MASNQIYNSYLATVNGGLVHKPLKSSKVISTLVTPPGPLALA